MMRTCIFSMALFCVFYVAFGGDALLADFTTEQLKAIREKYSPCVVAIEFKTKVKGMGYLAQYLDTEVTSRTCGIVVDKSGLVVANAHVIRGRELGTGQGSGFEIGVKFFEPREYSAVLSDGRRLAVELLGDDDELNLAFLRLVAGAPQEYESVVFDPGRNLEIGDEVAVVGLLPPDLGHGLNFSTCRISAAIKRGFPTYLTTLPLDSFVGGLALGGDGKPVGIVGALVPEEYRESQMGMEGIARFFMEGSGVKTQYPVVFPARVFEAAVANPPAPGKERAWLGVMEGGLRALTPEVAKEFGIESAGGVIIENVAAGSPLAKADVMPGDIMISMGGQSLNVADDCDLYVFNNLLKAMHPGDEVECVVLRRSGGTYVQVSVKAVVGVMPPLFSELAAHKDPVLGVSLKEVTPDFCAKWNLPFDTKGVVVVELSPAGDAYFSGVQKYDIIRLVNGSPVENIAEYQKAVEAVKSAASEAVKLGVLRQGRPYELTIEMMW